MSTNATAAGLAATRLNPADNRAPLTYTILGTLLPWATLVVALRFYARVTTRRVGADDWVTLVSLVSKK